MPEKQCWRCGCTQERACASRCFWILASHTPNGQEICSSCLRPTDPLSWHLEAIHTEQLIHRRLLEYLVRQVRLDQLLAGGLDPEQLAFGQSVLDAVTDPIYEAMAQEAEARGEPVPQFIRGRPRPAEPAETPAPAAPAQPGDELFGGAGAGGQVSESC